MQGRKITFDGIILGLRADHLERAPDTKGQVISKKVSFESEIFFTSTINLKQVYLSRAG